jgi:hypothetical protein
MDNIPAGVLPRLDEIEGQMNALQKHTDGSLFNIREEIRKEHALLANQIHEIPGRASKRFTDKHRGSRCR